MYIKQQFICIQTKVLPFQYFLDNKFIKSLSL